jgi:monoamine oxidase
LTKKIIIIGAGLAGLAACQRLKQAGFEPIILEARSRIGGRVVVDDSFAAPISCGAAWIHGVDANPMAEIGHHQHLSMPLCDFNHIFHFNQQHQVIDNDLANSFEESMDHHLRQAQFYANQSESDMSLSKALHHVFDPETLSPDEYELFKNKLAFFQGYYAADYTQISARHWDLEQTWPGDNCYIKETYQPIVESLAAGCNIQLNQVVNEIHLLPNEIKIVTSHGDYHADQVIVTVPLGVLKNNAIKFVPALPANKQEAINRIGMGLLNVSAIQFPTVFWPEQCQGLTLRATDEPSMCIYFNLHHFTGAPILVGYYGGERSRELELLSDEELQGWMMRQLREQFGAEIPEPVKFVTTRWSQDPYSRGSYSYPAVGVVGRDYETLAEPVEGRLFFAGEATHEKHMATTHGAYLSGVREADRVVGG